MLEIGIAEGSSILTWRDYFPYATIYAIDLQIPDRVQNLERIRCNVADQSKSNQLEDVMQTWNKPMFDIILDDGGHSVKQQRTSIETLWKYVKQGGQYIIEDLHTNIRYFHAVHPHLSVHGTWIDETPTVHERILSLMGGSKTSFNVPFEEIDEIR